MVIARTPAEAFPPGQFIKEELTERGWSQADLADIMGRDEMVISAMANAKRRVTPELARGLSDAFGTSPQFWLNLESAYQLSLLSEHDDTAVRRARLWTIAPIREMIKRNWIAPSDNVTVLERRVLEYFEIESLDDEIVFLGYAARKSTSYDVTTPAQAAWLYRAKQLARAVHAQAFSQEKLDNAIKKLRSLARQAQEIRHVPNVLAEVGVRLVVIEPLPQSRMDGACIWLDEGSPVIALAMRFDRIDYFWHTLFHEVGHIRQGRGATDVDIWDKNIDRGAERPEHEVAADRFASETLVPAEELDNFVMRMNPIYPKTKIKAFAARVGVEPGIVVGQLQHRGYINYADDREMLTKIRGIITQSALTDGWGSVVPAGLKG